MIRTAAVLLLLAIASCDRPAGSGNPVPASAPTFGHSMDSDLSGYYLPMGDVRIGNWSFDHVFIGQASEFQGWEAGNRSEIFGPVMLQFNDISSPMVQTEIGEARSVTARVLPAAYSVTDTRITFEGRSPELGAVRFDGVLDPEGLATARRNLGDEGVVITGRLTVGKAPARDVQLRWWGGD